MEQIINPDFFLQRFDKDGAIPYYCPADFPGLVCKQGSFQNSADVLIQYFVYCYEGYDKDKLILFCPGMGPGHTAYLAEIETLCRAGYRVLTLDYTGCGASGGERMPSINAPTQDAMELLDLLHPQEEIIPIGHSLGGYTVLNISHLTPGITRAVILSGFVDTGYGELDNRAYLAATKDQLLWIHSTDDPMVNYEYNAGQVLKMGNPNVRVITVEDKKHNPQYALEAVETMYAWIGEYTRLIQEKQLNTPEERKAYFADKPIGRMTAQDPAVYDEILQFIEA